ncbi:helicase associated domain-containing protein [Arthrobacter sp. Z1-15]
MTGTTTLESAEPESWTPQHWSREEWFYMWTKGLDPWRIAVLCRVPYRKVYDHIRTRITYHPELLGQRLMVHDHPALPPGGLKKPKPTWEERAADLADFRQVHGRFPRGYLEGESSLYSFLQSQRGRYRAGKLLESRKHYLDENLSGWLTPPKAEREHTLWQQRLGELEKFLRETGRYPRYKTAASSAEKVLAVWYTHQRFRIRSGKLSELREKKLGRAIPGWNLHSSQTNEGC